LPKPHKLLVAMSRTPTAFSRAPGSPGLGYGAEPSRGTARGHPGWPQCGARTQLYSLDPGPWGLGEPPVPLGASFYPIVM
jgi:hypothetical protein